VIYLIEFRPRAFRQLAALPKPAQRRILNRIEGLARDPRPRGSRKLTGADRTWRIRIGDYRVVYDVLDKKLVVLVVRVAHRREAYRRP